MAATTASIGFVPLPRLPETAASGAARARSEHDAAPERR
jgi:hypothetical protein